MRDEEILIHLETIENEDVIKILHFNSIDSRLKNILFLFSDQSIYAIDLTTKSIINKSNEPFANVMLIDNEYLYSIQNEN
jgi:hypothetical protein